MKKYIGKILLPLAIVTVYLTVTSCKKYLDKSPLADIDEKEAFQSFRNFQGFTEELYNCVPVITAVGSHNNWNFGEDEIWELGETRLLAYNFDHGNYWEWNNPYIFGSWFKNGGNASSTVRGDKGNLWGLSWYAIRKANIGLANLDLLVEATPEEKRLIEGQLYFFRGWFHFMLMQYWGGLPYIDVLLPPDQAPRVQRLNYHETAEKVALDLRKAADLLPVDWDLTAAGALTKGNNERRANKIMALAFLGKNLLFAGSPLMNEESTGSRTYNIDFCKRAAEALGEALQVTESTNRYQLIPFEHYSRVFYVFGQTNISPGYVTITEPGAPDRTYRESIMQENPAELNGRFRWNQATDYRPDDIIPNAGIKVFPTANYIDNYGMANGLPINMVNPSQADPESGYDPQYPWKNRDPRFYHDIMIDGEKAVTNPALVGQNEYKQYASLFTNGSYRVSHPTKRCLTGYMLSKYVSKLANLWEGYIDNNNMALSLLRLSDLYLLYAEAASEGYNSPTGKSSNYGKTAVEAVNFVRDRPGLNVGHVAPKFLGSQEAFRSEYRRERAVELSFEGHRFVDLRRWLLLTEQPYTYKKAVEFDRDMPNAQVYADPKNARVKNFRQTVIFERKLEKRHYWFPFLVNDVSMYEGFTQNPGW